MWCLVEYFVVGLIDLDGVVVELKLGDDFVDDYVFDVVGKVGDNCSVIFYFGCN